MRFIVVMKDGTVHEAVEHEPSKSAFGCKGCSLSGTYCGDLNAPLDKKFACSTINRAISDIKVITWRLIG